MLSLVANRVLIQWTSGLNKSVEGKVVAIDGKKLRRSFDTATGKNALHVVSAWVEDNNWVLGQVTAEGRGHELTQILELIKLLELKILLLPLMLSAAKKKLHGLFEKKIRQIMFLR